MEGLTSSISYLTSDAARESLAVDPYWPKWDSPWWHILAMDEAGAGADIPPAGTALLAEAFARHYPPVFPKTEAELPPGLTFERHILCHCALGCALRVLEARGHSVVPWAGEWIAREQLPDGGWNCDEKSRAGSFLSTVPVLEYLLARPSLGAAEEGIIDRGVAYLLERKLFRSARSGKIIDESWLVPVFPRFYDYDLLRGLSVVATWSRRLSRKVPPEAVAEARALVDQALGANVSPRRCSAKTTWSLDGESWVRRPLTTFPLLETLSRPEVATPLLRAERDRL
jgi:hypothetical protein